jgi:predicted component of type VI protein secretion system
MTWLEYNEALQELRADSEVVVGTGAQATWRVRRADLMPRHFAVCMTGDETTIRPFSSDAVVTVNGRQLPSGKSVLHDGDVIAAGSGEFRFWAGAPGESRSMTKAPVLANLIDSRRNSALTLQRVSTGIGKDESNALIIDDADAASFHAEVRREAGGHVLRASDSASVRLNGRVVSAPVMLNEGDEIEIANLALRYSREQLPASMGVETVRRITSEVEVSSPALPSQRVTRSPLTDLSSAVTVRTPMRAVAFVSSVIAAVAIATLLFLHRGP